LQYLGIDVHQGQDLWLSGVW